MPPNTCRGIIVGVAKSKPVAAQTLELPQGHDDWDRLVAARQLDALSRFDLRQ